MVKRRKQAGYWWLMPIILSLSETGSHYVAQAGLKLTTACFSIPNAGITGINHCAQLIFLSLPKMRL
jgi:hypothetical protein